MGVGVQQGLHRFGLVAWCTWHPALAWPLGPPFPALTFSPAMLGWGGQPVVLELSRPASFWQLRVPAFEGGGNRGRRRHSSSLLLLQGGEGDGWWCTVGAGACG